MPAHSTFSALHILVADDNDANLLIIRTILERSGHRVETVQNGLHALSMTKYAAYDLIILDIMMPVMDGISALERIRGENSNNKNTLIFALTAYCDPERRQRYLSIGFDAILTKPLRNGELEKTIQSLEDHGGLLSMSPDEMALSKQVGILDETAIKRLLVKNSPETLQDMEVRFWLSIHTQCETIKSCLPAVLKGDKLSLTKFRRAVHAVKGTSASIGLARVTHISRQLQNAPQSDIARLMHDFVKALSESRPVLNQALSGTRKLDTAV